MSDSPFVSAGGLKLAAALDVFQLDPRGWACVDLGANVGGFTDCLLQRGAAHVHAVDTGYGQLAWKLRQHPDVTVMERTNAMHVSPPLDHCDLVVMDLGWTRQEKAIPAALAWGPRRVVSLIKPQYEQRPPKTARGVWDDASAERIASETIASLPSMGVRLIGSTPSAQRGGSGKGRAGNLETLVCLEPVAEPPST